MLGRVCFRKVKFGWFMFEYFSCYMYDLILVVLENIIDIWNIVWIYGDSVGCGWIVFMIGEILDRNSCYK